MPITTQIEIGSVISLWRYPVKSMMGEELNATEVTQRGLLGDRAYAVVDSSDDKIASAKNPEKMAEPFILRMAAQHNRVNVGVYANVARGGTIRRGDSVRLE